jgi:myosin-heavy-chain kinase
MAFSYFTHHVSGGSLVIADIQGVGTFYTDPQIHTLDGEGFGAGNLGERGIRRFLSSHHHSVRCRPSNPSILLR